MVTSSSDNTLICPDLQGSSEYIFLEMFEDQYACVKVSLNLVRYPVLYKLNLQARQSTTNVFFFVFEEVYRSGLSASVIKVSKLLHMSRAINFHMFNSETLLVRAHLSACDTKLK